MIAALPMYDRPETAAANDRLWAAIRDRLGHGPDRLDRATDPWAIWTDPELTLAQTCGLPFRTRLHDRVQLVGTPVYALPDCPPGHYRSVLVARRDASEPGPRLAYNDPLSQSGWAAPHAHAAETGLPFAPHLATGGHRSSARAVAEGRADIAAIDAVTWALIQRHDPEAAELREIARTRSTPGLPLVAGPEADTEALFAAVAEAIAALDPADRDTLLLEGLTAIPAAAYLALPPPPPDPATAPPRP